MWLGTVVAVTIIVTIATVAVTIVGTSLCETS